MTNYQINEAKRVGLNRVLEHAENPSMRMYFRMLRAENARRTAAAA